MATRSGQRRRGKASNRTRQAGQAQPQARRGEPEPRPSAAPARPAPAQPQQPQQAPAQARPVPAEARPAPAQARQARPAPAAARPRPTRRPPRRRQATPTLPGSLTEGLYRLSDASGIPGWALVTGALCWLLVLLLWAGGATKGSFAIWLGVILSAAIAVAHVAGRIASGKHPLRALRGAGLVFVAAALPAFFDPHSGDVFNLPKYTLLVMAALAVAGLWVISAVHERRLPAWRNGLQWVLAATVGWSLVSALAGVDTHVSLLGNYGSYDGWYAAAAFAVVTMVLAESLDVTDVRRALGAITFGGGLVVVVYGLIQLHDTELGGAKWDFIHWNLGSFSNDIFSTFGNPNHLGGYLAILLPVALIVGLSAKRWPYRVLTGLFVVALLAELIRTSARGAWVAAIASVVVLAIYLVPEIKRRPVPYLGGAGAVVVLAAAGMAVKGRHFLGHSLSTLFQSGGNTSVEQRFEIWTGAGQIALHHPVTGLGPDAFALVYPQYQSAKWVAGLGPNYLVNGAHDIFMNYLADQGFIGALIFIALLAFAGFRSVGAWRRFRSLERDESAGVAAQGEAREQRLMLAAVTASIAAYVVQGVFNVQQIGLSMMFWVMLGVLLVLATSAGVPDTLWAPALVSVPPAGRGQAPEPVEPSVGAPGKRTAIPPRRGRGGRQEVPWPSLVVGAVVVGAVAFLAVEADGPYRADHAYWAAYKSIGQTSGPTKAGTKTTPTQVTPTYFADMKKAISLNPWEPLYPYKEASVDSSVSQNAPATSKLTYLSQARTLFAQAVADQPLWSAYPAALAEADVEMANLQPASATTYLAEAKTMAQKAIKDNPRDAAYHQLLASITADQRKAAAAAAKAKAKPPAAKAKPKAKPPGPAGGKAK